MTSAGSAKALALRNGLILTGHMGCSKVAAESDCLPIIEVILDTRNCLGPDVAIYAECVQLAKNFGKMSFHFCKREANGVADYLAKTTFSSRSSTVWDTNTPNFISSFLMICVLFYTSQPKKCKTRKTYGMCVVS